MFDCFEDGGLNLNTILGITLPALERDETTAGLQNDELLEALQVHDKDRIQFLLNEFSKLDNTLRVKDFLWEALKMWISIEPDDQKFSRPFNKLSDSNIFYQKEIIKKFDHLTLITTKLPPSEKLNRTQLEEVSSVIKKSLLLSMRETDPSTYMDLSTLRYYSLEQGISIALYGMKSERQLPLQSYIGYTLFKNTYPVAYGGSWIFGKTAQFGLNIFEAFRGGESGYMMCQLLRTYSQVFNIHYFEIDPYQFGRDNPDGIRSGAFWFYYRYGFRPVDKDLAQLAEKEFIKIKSKPAYRTNEKILLKFTESHIALRLEALNPIPYSVISRKVSQLIRKRFKGNRIEAVEVSVQEFKLKMGIKVHYKKNELSALTDIALMAAAMNMNDTNQLKILNRMIKLKPIDPYLYNHLLSELIA
jgi:hypothetical protein